MNPIISWLYDVCQVVLVGFDGFWERAFTFNFGLTRDNAFFICGIGLKVGYF
jgi:hypothetical protein